MKRIMLTALALGMMIAPLAGCSGDDKTSCKDACDKLNSCGFLGVSVSQCNTLCEDEATQGELDCISDSSCSQIGNGSCG